MKKITEFEVVPLDEVLKIAVPIDDAELIYISSVEDSELHNQNHQLDPEKSGDL